MSFNLDRSIPASQLPAAADLIAGVQELLAELAVCINRLQAWPPFESFCNDQIWRGKHSFPTLACRLTTADAAGVYGIQTAPLDWQTGDGEDAGEGARDGGDEAGDGGRRWIVALNPATGWLSSDLTYHQLLPYLAEAEGGAALARMDPRAGSGRSSLMQTPIDRCQGWYHDKMTMLMTIGSYLEAQQVVLPVLLGLDTRFGGNWTRLFGSKLLQQMAQQRGRQDNVRR
ncbi:MAG: hypothetical protein ACK5WY_07240 [Holosporaceae bacterium]|nr:hypothetical protein [Rhodospirillaceae bacterium]